MSEVTKNVILDLLPLYLAGEASEDSAALVKQYIESSPEVAALLNQMKKAESLYRVPAPFSTEVAMKTFQEAKKWTVIRTLGLTFIIGIVFLVGLFLTYYFVYSWGIGRF